MEKPDANAKEIVRGLRDSGCTVETLPGGRGRPDLLVGLRLRNYLLEVKVTKGKLSQRQVDWHRAWRGQVTVVRSLEDALVAVGLRPVDASIWTDPAT